NKELAKEFLAEAVTPEYVRVYGLLILVTFVACPSLCDSSQPTLPALKSTEGMTPAPAKLETTRLTAKDFRVYKREQAGIARRMLYPVTAFYTCFSVI